MAYLFLYLNLICLFTFEIYFNLRIDIIVFFKGSIRYLIIVTDTCGSIIPHDDD